MTSSLVRQFYFLSFVCTFISISEPVALSAPPLRLKSAIDENIVFHVKGNTNPRISGAKDRGAANRSLRLPQIVFHLQMSTQQHEDLSQLLRRQQIPGATSYHSFLTPEEYADRFGVNASDMDGIKAWLEKEGFSNVQFARSHTFISFEGTAGVVKNAFHTEIHTFSVGDEDHYANATDPILPAAFSGIVRSISGLHNFKRKPKAVRRRRPSYTSSLSGMKYLVPADFATIYNLTPVYSSGLDGLGIRIAVVGQSDIQLTDIRAFRQAAALSPNDPAIVLYGADPGIQSASGDEGESDLDVEWAGAIARNATVVFVTSSDVETATNYAIDNAIAPILSTSYGLCEAQVGQAESDADSAEYQQANAEGMTVVASAGDNGAADCDTNYPVSNGLAVDEPASFPYVTGVGGSTLNDGTGSYWSTTNTSAGGSALSYIPEVAWNDASAENALLAGGGGASILNEKPSWQIGIGVPSDAARDVPDIALAASPNHDGYLICSDGDCVNGFRNSDSTLDVIGGTSAGAPTFAGILALIVQSAGAQGNVNPKLYSMAATAPTVFHDITSGNNMVACIVGTPNCTSGQIGFSAGIGYDQVTGLGSVDAHQLIAAWSGSSVSTGVSTNPLEFVPMTPCRVVDTRSIDGPFGGPKMLSGMVRQFDLPDSNCQIPSTASAYALNVTVVPDGELGYLSVWAGGQGQPLASTLNSDGRVKANAAIVPAGSGGGIDVYVSDPTHVIIDVSGYFVPSGSSESALQFFPVTPCRIADTRGAIGTFGGPHLTGGSARSFPLAASSCSVPAVAQAYSLNFTAVPHVPLGFLSAWPTGQTQPEASILNASNGGVTANAAIIPAGTSGSVTTYASSDTDLIIDVNGYFAPAAQGGLAFYTLPPCRVIDTRNPIGAPLFVSPPAIVVNVPVSGCGTPSGAMAYVLNATVVPTEQLGFLALWPYGEAQPGSSTLNADSATTTSNLAIVPTITGSISAFASNPTYLILDISGYFAP